MSEDDAIEIRRMLEHRIEAVCDSLAPGWRRRGNTGYLTPKSAKDLGSFTVSLGHGGKMPRGCWYRFSQHVGGGSVELVSYLLQGRKDAYKEAFSWAREFLGMSREEISSEERENRNRRRAELAADDAKRRAAQEAQEAVRKEQRAQTAQEVWDQCSALRGSHGEAYLCARGLPPCSEWPWDPHDAIRFHPSHRYELDRDAGSFPTIIARVRDAWGDTAAVWRIYLDKKTPRKAPVDNPKVGLGPAGGGAVRIGGIGKKIGIGEGLETCLAAWALEGFRYPVWAGLSTSGVTSFEPPLEIERVNIFPDGDLAKLKDGGIMGPPGMAAAKSLRDRLAPTGIKVSISKMCLQGDALDLLITKRNYEKDHPESP